MLHAILADNAAQQQIFGIFVFIACLIGPPIAYSLFFRDQEGDLNA